MKVAFICSTLQQSGPIIISYNLITSLTKHGVQPVIITLSSEPTKSSKQQDFINFGVPIYSLTLGRVQSLIIGHRRLEQLLKTLEVDIIHTCGFRADVISASLSARWPTISTLHNFPFEDLVMEYGNILGRWMANKTVKAYRHIGSVIACSHAIADRMNVNYNLSIGTIHNGIQIERYTPESDKVTARKSIGLKEDHTTYIFIGRLIERKDPLTVIRAFQAIDSSAPYQLIILGDGPLMNECKKAAQNSEKFHFFGSVADIHPFLKASDIYVASSLSEGFPTSVMEAMATGLPVILSDISQHREVAEGVSDASIFFPTGDVEQLSEIFRQGRIFEDISRKSNTVRQHTVNKLSSQHMAEQYFLEYTRLIERFDAIKNLD